MSTPPRTPTVVDAVALGMPIVVALDENVAGRVNVSVDLTEIGSAAAEWFSDHSERMVPSADLLDALDRMPESVAVAVDLRAPRLSDDALAYLRGLLAVDDGENAPNVSVVKELWTLALGNRRGVR